MRVVVFVWLLAVIGCGGSDGPVKDCRALGCMSALCDRHGDCTCNGEACRFLSDAGITDDAAGSAASAASACEVVTARD